MSELASKDRLREALAEWDRLGDARAVMKAEGITFADVLSYRATAIDALIDAARATVVAPVSRESP